MASEIDEGILIEDGAASKEEQMEWEDLLNALKGRCDAASIGFTRKTIIGFNDEPHEYAYVDIPNGREKRTVVLSNDSRIREFLAIQFEDIVYLGDLNAFVNYKNGVIEAMIASHDIVPTSSWMQRLSRHYCGNRDQLSDPATPLVVSEHEEGGGHKIIIGKASSTAATLRETPSDRFFTFRIEGCKVSTHDTALKLLRRVSDALFFQIDLSTSIALRLVKTRRLNSGFRGRPQSKELIPLVFPKQEYDEAPISLYWYARSATSMPLLQYLAYYQVIEFYFPTFFQKEIARRLKSLLKDPLFRVDRDADITRLLSTIKSSNPGTRGSERDQIKATINECISASEIRDFLEEEEERSKFFFAKKLPLNKDSLNSKSSDLRDDVAEIIYEIRCKIVHTKGDDGQDPTSILLPFSKEAELLRPYLELMRFVSGRVLISASTKFTL